VTTTLGQGQSKSNRFVCGLCPTILRNFRSFWVMTLLLLLLLLQKYWL